MESDLSGGSRNTLYFFFSIRVYFIEILTLKFVKLQEYFRNKPETENLKRTSQFCMLKIRKYSTIIRFDLTV